VSQPAGTLPVMPSDTDLRLRRLQRLRGLDARLRTASELMTDPRPPAPLPMPGRAARLATTIGGRVLETDEGAIVAVEQRTMLPFDPGPLAVLPYPIEAGRPLILLDTETTGLGTGTGTIVFLVGVGAWVDGELLVTQLWLPDHAAEPAFLSALAALVPPDAWLVTYNGRTFDWPLLTTRYRLGRRPVPAIAGHLDLLPVARQLFRHRLPDARLASVEAGVAGVRRLGDLPGVEVPGRYFDWLRNGQGDLLNDVLEHNRQDVISLARLLVVIADRLVDPAGRKRAHPEDLASLGRAYRRSGRNAEALRCLDAALALPDPDRRSALGWFDRGQAWLDQASLFAAAGRSQEALDAWHQAVRCGGRTAVRAWIALAKFHEHRRRNPGEALAAAERAAAVVAQRRAIGHLDLWAERDLGRRLRRLRRRCGMARC
jgi:tetratricopeptide (TPR) repeat protein